MQTFFIIPRALYEATDWQASECCNVAPRLILSGAHAGSYAVNTALFQSDPSFEKFRDLLEALETAELSASDLNPAQESA